VEYLHTTGLARLADKVGLVSLVHTREQASKVRQLAAAGVSLYLWTSPALATESSTTSTPSAVRRVGRRVARAVYDVARASGGRPRDTLVADLHFRNMAPAILEALTTETWQATTVVQSSSARWLDYLPRPAVTVLMMHDVRALLYEREARTLTSPRKRLGRLLEARRYRRFERDYCRAYDLVVTVSATDADYVRRHYAPARCVTVPIPLDATYFSPNRGVAEAPARILFTGHMAHPPNVAAACYFAREILPLVQQTVPEAEFWIVGRDPAPEARALAARGVVVTGTVDDIRPHLARATVVVVPLRFGSGMRQKILEAWAMEKAVVSTRLGAEGLGARDGVNILLADDAEAFATAVARLLQDRTARDQIRIAGRAVVLADHDPDRLTRLYHDSIAAVVRERRAGSEPFRAVVDLRWMQPGVAGGIENLSRSFLNELLRLDAFNRYTLLLPAETRYDFDRRGRPNATVRVADGPRPYGREAVVGLARRLARGLGVQYWRTPEVEALRRARELDAEVALSIPGYIHPDLKPLANVLVAPDIQHEYHPEFFTEPELAERRWLYTDSSRQAAHICAISDFTRSTLIERLAIPEDRITTTHLAADPMFHPGSPARAAPGRVLEKYGLSSGDYVLFPGNTWPHKNHPGAFRALRVLRDAHGLKPLLVCTGARRDSGPGLASLLAQLDLDSQVRFLGYCPAVDMPGLYEGARAMVCPSLFEGFGMPVLEAMWCGCPVVCSNSTSLPEVAGDAALTVDPRSPEALADALARALGDDAVRRRLIARGLARAALFSWTRFTLEVVRILHDVREARFR
jgi:glycosyltransferase involved in cell wall biosynthesis